MSNGIYNVCLNGINVSNLMDSIDNCNNYIWSLIGSHKKVKTNSGLIVKIKKGDKFDVINNDEFKIENSIKVR